MASYRCLNINEVLSLVIEHVYGSDQSPNCSDLASLARSCRLFSEPAIDVLWRTLYDFRPLVKCMPSALWAEGWSRTLKLRGRPPDYVYLKRPVVASDWERFMYYAPRVKRLLFRPQITETSLFASTLSATTYTALGLGSPYPNILPNLVELDWSGSPDIFACGKVMVGPKLKALTLRSVHPASSRKATGTVTLLQHLHTLAPHNLHSLSLYFPSGVNDLPKEAEALRPFHNLRSLTIQTRGPTFDPDLLSQVASLPYLKCLTLDATYRYTQHQTFIDSVHVFPTLTTISCLNGMIRDCETMFRRIRLPAIQHINISAAFVDGLTVLPDILKNCSHTSLRTLRIESGELFPRAVPPSSIASLYSFHAMQELIIHTDTPLILSDSALEDMARAWPHLRVLDLVCNIDATRDHFFAAYDTPLPPVSLAGLLALANHSPELHTLCMPVGDPRLPPVPHGARPGGGVVGASTTTLGVALGDDALDEPARVAAFLADVFPHVQTIRSKGHYGSAWDEVAHLGFPGV